MATARIIRWVSAIMLIITIIGGISIISDADRQFNDNKKYLEYATVNGGYRVNVSSWDPLYHDYPKYAEGRGNKAVEAQAKKKYAIIGMAALSILSLLGFGFASIIASNAKTAEAAAQMLRQNSFDSTVVIQNSSRQNDGFNDDDGSEIKQ